MKKRPCCQLAVGVLCGILLAKLKCGWLFFPVFALIIIGVVVNRRKQQIATCEVEHRWRTFLVVVSFFMAVFGYVRECSVEQIRAKYETFLEEGETILLQGKLTGKAEKKGQYLYELSSCQVGQRLSTAYTVGNHTWMDCSCNTVQVSMKSDDYSIGENLIIEGKINSWKKARNEGNFDAKSFYQAKGIEFQLKDAMVLETDGKSCKWKEHLYQWKQEIKSVYQTQLPEYEGGILATMVLGDKALLDEEVKQAYQVVGISHILAISGLHVSFLGMLFFQLLRKLRVGYLGAAFSSSLILLCYGEMVGFGTSVFRAVCMFLLLVVAQTIGRSYDTLNALGFAGMCILIENPEILYYAGFQLSFGAVLGVVLFGRMVKEYTKGYPWLEKILMGMAIQVAILPIVAWYYYEIPIYAVVVNLIVLPLMGMVLSCGMAGGMLGLYKLEIAKYVFLPCKWILHIYQKICDITKELPDPVYVTGRPAVWKLIVYYGILFLFIYVFYRNRTKEEEQKHSLRKIIAGIVTGCFLLLFLFFPKQSGFRLDVLDVGQGDGIFLCTDSGHTLFIDGGSSDVSKVGTYRIEPFLKYNGIRKIDFWVVSHTDSDHISGLQEILETEYPIGCLLFAKEIEHDDAYENLVKTAKKRGTEIVFVEQEQILHLGNAKVQALSPSKDTTGDKNARSLVLMYEEDDFTGIFTGDIGIEQEKKILEKYNLKSVDFYKSAHHGSNNSNSKELLEEIKPVVTVVSCGKNNRYGHPGKDAVARMEDVGSKIFYTMDHGQIMVRKKRGGYCVTTYLE